MTHEPTPGLSHGLRAQEIRIEEINREEGAEIRRDPHGEMLQLKEISEEKKKDRWGGWGVIFYGGRDCARAGEFLGAKRHCRANLSDNIG